ncbi:MAG: ABC transporter ATP-binding protein [Cyanobacteriota bacterium]|nr:ABC transporter ATP-binding protein [Cyanobacteriota bacterium]
MSTLMASHLHKTYRSGRQRITAVNDVSLTLKSGEILAFLGANGAGKTTTVKMIAGLIRPDRGQVRIEGRDPYQDTSVLGWLGAVLEGNRNLYWRLTPIQNLEYFGVLRGLSQRVSRQRAEQLLDQFQLAHKRQTPVEKLSRGMQQKVAIAVALIHHPPLLLLDEPTLGLDVESTQQIKSRIREIANAGQSILLTTHQLDMVETLADRVSIIHRGEIIVESTPKQLIQQFSSATYRIELAEPLDTERMIKLQSSQVTIIDTQTISFAHTPEKLYQTLDILRPLPLILVKKEEADLTQVFLKLVRDHD